MGTLSRMFFNKINVSFKKSLRIIENKKQFEHSEPILKQYGLLSLQDMYVRQCVLFYHKWIHNLLPIEIQNLLSYRKSSTRSNNKPEAANPLGIVGVS